jgi:hypothetical protein
MGTRTGKGSPELLRALGAIAEMPPTKRKRKRNPTKRDIEHANVAINLLSAAVANFTQARDTLRRVLGQAEGLLSECEWAVPDIKDGLRLIEGGVDKVSEHI